MNIYLKKNGEGQLQIVYLAIDPWTGIGDCLTTGAGKNLFHNTISWLQS